MVEGGRTAAGVFSAVDTAELADDDARFSRRGFAPGPAMLSFRVKASATAAPRFNVGVDFVEAGTGVALEAIDPRRDDSSSVDGIELKVDSCAELATESRWLMEYDGC